MVAVTVVSLQWQRDGGTGMVTVTMNGMVADSREGGAFYPVTGAPLADPCSLFQSSGERCERNCADMI